MVMTDAVPRARRQLSRAGGFWLAGATVLLLLAASSAPSPLYVVYQQRFGFSPATLTAVFGIYALTLLAALLTVGGLSDHLGRRPVLLAALLLEALGMLVFLSAQGVGTLLLARALQGFATGAATATASAVLVDLQPDLDARRGALVTSVASSLGLAAGALGSGLLVQFAPAPTTVVFVVLAVTFVVLAAVLRLLPESVTARPGALASLRPRLSVPPHARRDFVATTPVLVATWAMGGLYLSLGPSVSASVLQLRSHLTGALVVVAFTASGAVTAALCRDAAPRRSMLAGSAALAAGTLVTLLALETRSAPAFFVGTAVAGAGFGPAFLGAFRSLALLATPEQRAELLAAVYIVSYLAFSIPAVVAGRLVTPVGLRAVAMAYAGAVTALALIALLPAVASAARSRRASAVCQDVGREGVGRDRQPMSR